MNKAATALGLIQLAMCFFVLSCLSVLFGAVIFHVMWYWSLLFPVLIFVLVVRAVVEKDKRLNGDPAASQPRPPDQG